jgi:probable HAF family extracellular repeat protein
MLPQPTHASAIDTVASPLTTVNRRWRFATGCGGVQPEYREPTTATVPVFAWSLRCSTGRVAARVRTASVLLVCATAVLVTAVSPRAQQQALPHFTIVDLGTLGGDSSQAAGINLLGDVVGSSTLANGRTHGFVYRVGLMFDIGTFAGGTESYATAISDNGVIVGYSGINCCAVSAIPEFKYIGFVWQDGTMQSVGAWYCWCSFNRRYGDSSSFAVNNAGIAVGWARDFGLGTPMHAFRFHDGRLDNIGDTTGNGGAISIAYGINDVGEVTGVNDGQAFLLRNGVRQVLGIPPGFTRSEGRAINGKGQIAGIALNATTGISRGFFWDLGTMGGLEPWPGDASSEALAMNISSDIVGRSGSAGFATSRAMLWRNATGVDLNALVSDNSWMMQTATGINNIGQIVGTGVHNGQTRAFLLQP